MIAFSWYGGKYSHLDWLLPLLPDTPSYCEPFGGSAAVLLNRKPCGTETYNDADGEIVNFFRVLREQRDELLTQLELTPYSREEFIKAIENEESISDLEKARRFYIKARMSFNSRTGALRKGDWGFSKSGTSRNMAKRVSAWLKSFDGLVDVAVRLRQVQIENDNAISIIQRYDSEETLFYCDPPYPFESRGRNEQRYNLEMTDDEHVDLAHCLYGVQGLVAVSGYRCDMMDSLYKSWNRYDAPAKRLPSSGDDKTEKTECLWTNYDVNKFKSSQARLL